MEGLQRTAACKPRGCRKSGAQGALFTGAEMGSNELQRVGVKSRRIPVRTKVNVWFFFPGEGDKPGAQSTSKRDGFLHVPKS